MKMTISLLQAYDWYLECPPDWKASARKQIVDQLNKLPFDNAAVARGQAYEDKICQALLTGQEVHPELACLKGMRQQAWLQPYTVAGYTFRGKMDFDDTEKIIDLKTTKKYNMRSYVSKKQHKVYALAENKSKFTYLVAVFPDEVSLEPTDIKRIDLVLDLEQCAKDILEAVTSFEKWLKDESLWELYFKTYNGGMA